jgi:cell division protein FtsI (penicillin-binding protein 3)
MLTDGITKEIFNDNVDSLSICMANLFRDRPASEYKRVLRNARREGLRFYLLKKNVSYKQLLQVKKFPIFRLGRFKGGLIPEQKNRREMPLGQLALRTIGSNRTGAEPVGIEGSFDKYLKGEHGLRLMQRISGGVWKPLNYENEIDPKDGNDVITTIDINIQDVAQNSLYTQLKQHNADRGCAILMEVSTGAVLAIANLQKGTDGGYYETYNFAVGESTEPGSTFKLASVMALLEDGYVDLDDPVDTQGGTARFSNRIMRDSHDGGYGVIPLGKVFELSSNVGISKTVHKYYSRNPQAFVDRLKSFGIGQKLGLQIPGEGNPLLRNTDDKFWSKVSLPWLSIGYESSMTPLQTLAFYNSVANGGKLVRPQFVKEIRNKGVVIEKFDPVILRDSIASPSTLAAARKILEGVVERGTATNLKHAQYLIAGKTGTAQIATPGEGYKKGKVRYQASFVGYFPADNPRYSCMVVVYAPNNNLYYASQVAAPIFKEIADKVYATNIELHKELIDGPDLALALPQTKAGYYRPTEKVIAALNIPAKLNGNQSDWVTINKRNDMVEFSPVRVRHDQVPAVVGMGLRDALYLLESCGLQVRTIGRGTVKKQSINAGSKFEKGQEIVIQLG